MHKGVKAWAAHLRRNKVLFFATTNRILRGVSDAVYPPAEYGSIYAYWG